MIQLLLMVPRGPLLRLRYPAYPQKKNTRCVAFLGDYHFLLDPAPLKHNPSHHVLVYSKRYRNAATGRCGNDITKG